MNLQKKIQEAKDLQELSGEKERVVLTIEEAEYLVKEREAFVDHISKEVAKNIISNLKL